MAAVKEPRRTKLATIVGSGLAVVAAGSLLAFSTLAEQAGLEGLATGRVEPARPARSGAHAITIPAPSTAPPSDPRGLLEELVRDSANRTATEPQPRIAFVPPPEAPAPEKPEPRRRRADHGARVVVVEPEVEEPVEAETDDGPPYGHAYGHYKNRDKDKYKDKDKPKDAKPAKKDDSKPEASDEPVYARSANEESESKPPKAPKLEKVKKDKKQTSPGNGNGHSKGRSDDSDGNGKAKGHSKHAHKGKGKGHSKHGG